MELISRAAGARLSRSPCFAGLLAALAASVHRHEHEYQRVRKAEPCLAPYPTTGHLLAVLSSTSALLMDDRQAIVRVLLQRQQAKPHPLWQALLFEAFAPALRCLHARDRGSKSDRGQRITCAFLEALEKAPADAKAVFVTIPRATARILFERVRTEQKNVEDTDALTERTIPRSGLHGESGPFQACLAREVAERLSAQPGGDDVVRLLAGAETIGEQVARLSGRGRRVSRGGVKQRRQRALREIRADLAGGATAARE